MKLKDFIVGKVHNIKMNDKEMLNNDADVYDDWLAIGKGYVFYIYEYIATVELGDVVCMYGTESLILFNKKTKKFVSEGMR